jgi:oligopeptide transport system substrate-binding protein
MGLEKAPELTYIYNASQIHAKVAQLLQSHWKQQLGLTIHLVGLDWAVFLQRARSGDFDLARFGWRAQFSDPVTFLEIFDSKEGSYNLSRFDDERFRFHMRQAKFCTKNDRINHLVEAEKIILEESAVIPLFFESHTYLKNPSLKGVIIGPLGRIDFKLAYWEKPNS